MPEKRKTPLQKVLEEGPEYEKTIADLQARLSAAEHDAAMYHECRDQWKQQAESLQARLSAAEKRKHGWAQLAAKLEREVHELQARLSAAEKENEFHKKALEEWNCKAEERLDTINDLQSRLSELQDFHAKKMDEMYARLSAAEGENKRLWNETVSLDQELENLNAEFVIEQDKLKRAEEVVEAVRQRLENSEGPYSCIMSAGAAAILLRRYEEGEEA